MSGPLFYGWVLAGGLSVIIVGLAYRRFLIALPQATRRLFLLGALMQADELMEARARAAEAQAALARLQSDHFQLERRATTALDTAARRIEALTARAG